MHVKLTHVAVLILHWLWFCPKTSIRCSEPNLKCPNTLDTYRLFRMNSEIDPSKTQDEGDPSTCSPFTGLERERERWSVNNCTCCVSEHVNLCETLKSLYDFMLCINVPCDPSGEEVWRKAYSCCVVLRTHFFCLFRVHWRCCPRCRSH